MLSFIIKTGFPILALDNFARTAPSGARKQERHNAAAAQLSKAYTLGGAPNAVEKNKFQPLHTKKSCSSRRAHAAVRSTMGAFMTKLLDTLYTKKLEVVLVGLENSGKTTLLNVLAQGRAVETCPTIGLNVKLVRKGGVQMKCWDIGGQAQYRSEFACRVPKV
jgi:ATPase subunit of ABC transporter with duplicated ATPase domains